MIKQYENYEVWFVTGAQLLYGGDAVVQVDGHSNEMVAGMNASGLLPVKVVYKGTANSSSEVLDVMTRAESDPKRHPPRTSVLDSQSITTVTRLFMGWSVQVVSPCFPRP